MNQDYDIVIAGSGLIGSAYARILAERAPDLRVLMLEAGPRLTPVAGVNVRNEPGIAERARYQLASEGPEAAADPDHRAEYSARPGTHRVRRRRPGSPDQDDMPDASASTNVGGMGAHWTCACPSPYGSERIAFIKDTEWAELEAEAARLLHVTTEGFDPTAGARATLAGLSAAFDASRPPGRQVQPMPLACTPRPGASPRWSGADTVLGPLAVGPHDTFELRPDTIVRRILHSAGRVSGVEAAGRDGVPARISARVVVVAADALRTPQLLWASGIRPPALGRYLNDQPQVVAAVSVRTPGSGTSAGQAELNYGQGESDQRDLLAGVAWVPFADGLHPFHGQVMQLDASPVDLGIEDPSGVVVGLGWFCAKEIRAEDRLEFDDDEPDAFGLPSIRIRYRLTGRDREQIQAAMTQQRRAAAALGGFIPGGEPRLLPAGTSLHYQGTVRMGEADDGTSVCDPASAVWGVAGLYVGGNGVIPTATACNPTLTSVALAVRAARGIAERT
ncbi:MAG TPA: GMC oxidoreductase [Streptosporangiaceae bacterium]|nr:GMC oxidoreductase [Streptosporangiaceae bacterium]